MDAAGIEPPAATLCTTVRYRTRARYRGRSTAERSGNADATTRHAGDRTTEPAA
jgi:hypothetical protein